MAKALFGHVGATSDLRLQAELTRLRARVQELESEVRQLRTVNADLAEAVRVHDRMLALTVPDSVSAAEPALT